MAVGKLFHQAIAQQDRSKKQLRVLATSLQLFSQQGYERMTTHDIARLASVAQGTVYNSIGRKMLC